MESVYRQLDQTDGQFLKYSSGSINITDVLTTLTPMKPSHYKYFDYIFWLNTNGKQIAQISPFSKQEELINLSDRDYFKYSDEWFWPYDVINGKNRFRMESIMSVKSGDYKAAFSRPSYSPGLIIALTSRFYSVIDPLIPKGYKFCIIDAAGNVWFHSNKYQNLAENFVQECNDDKLLQAALYADVAKSLIVNYYNTPHRIYIRHLDGLPLYLVTMYDLRLENSFQAQVFITTLLLISGLFAFMIFQILLVLLLKWIFEMKGNTWKFRLEFMRLKPGKINDYMHLILILAFSLFIMIAFISRMPDVMAIIMILILITILFSITLVYLKDIRFGFWAVLIYIFFNTLIFIALKYFLYPDVTIFQFRGSYRPLPIVLLLILIVSYFMFRKSYYRINMKPDVAYSILILLMVLLFGVVPILKFFNIAANLENKIAIRYGQLELTRARESRNKDYIRYYERIEDIRSTGKNTVRDNIHNQRKDDGVYLKFWYNTTLADCTMTHYQAAVNRSPLIDTLLYPFRPVYKDTLSVESKYLLIDTTQSQSYRWRISGDNGQFLYYKSPTEDLSGRDKKTMVVRSDLPETNIIKAYWSGKNWKNSFVDIFIFMIVLAIIFMIYGLILFATRRIFGVSLITDSGHQDLKNDVESQLKAGNPVILLNPSSSRGFQQLVKWVKDNFSTREFIWEDPKEDNKAEAWLVSDLLKDYRDPEAFMKNLKMLMNWLKTPEKLIIILENHPENISYYYKVRAEINKKPDPKADNPTDVKTESFRQAYELFQTFIQSIVILQVPVNIHHQVRESGEAKKTEAYNDNHTITPEALIAREISASDYLSGLGPSLDEYLAVLKEKKLELKEVNGLIMARISEMAEKYYHSLLETCSSEEKFILLDIVNDGITNIRNKQVIITLMRRGMLVKRQDSIGVMNESFHNFLLANFSKQDKQELKKALGAGPGKWAGYKIAIILIIAALFVFIFISNQDFLNNLNKMFITLGASIAGITSLLGLLGKKAKDS